MTDRVKPSATKKRPEQTETNKDRKPLPLDAAARVKARVVLALVLVGLALWTAASFLPALIWATILAVSLWPLYLKFAKRFHLRPFELGCASFSPSSSRSFCLLPWRLPSTRWRSKVTCLSAG